jgi:hypothetical protein
MQLDSAIPSNRSNLRGFQKECLPGGLHSWIPGNPFNCRSRIMKDVYDIYKERPGTARNQLGDTHDSM